MTNVVVFVVTQESAVAYPFSIVLGDAERTHVGFSGGGGGTTTVFSQCATPPGPVAVKWYVCVPTPSGGTKV